MMSKAQIPLLIGIERIKTLSCGAKRLMRPKATSESKATKMKGLATSTALSIKKSRLSKAYSARLALKSEGNKEKGDHSV